MFWESTFGADYVDRNASPELFAANLAFFAQVISRNQLKISSVLELGANIGMNFKALKALLPEVELTGVEINPKAYSKLREIADHAVNSSIEEFEPKESCDLVLTKGVLIHLSPESLSNTYLKISKASKRWVLLAEYFSRDPMSIPYRGHKDVLFKRDFCSEFLDVNSDDNWELRDYGFVSRHDIFPQDDINWYLLERAK